MDAVMRRTVVDRAPRLVVSNMLIYDGWEVCYYSAVKINHNMMVEVDGRGSGRSMVEEEVKNLVKKVLSDFTHEGKEVYAWNHASESLLRAGGRAFGVLLNQCW
jgi:hypothetical protein